jgi:hypothetical protein
MARRAEVVEVKGTGEARVVRRELAAIEERRRVAAQNAYRQQIRRQREEMYGYE